MYNTPYLHSLDPITQAQLRSLPFNPNPSRHGSVNGSTSSVSNGIFNPPSSCDPISLTSPSGLSKRVAKRPRREQEQVQQVPEFEASKSSPISSEESPGGTPRHELASDEETYVQSSSQSLNDIRRYRTILPKSPKTTPPTIRHEGYASNNPSVPMLTRSPSMPTPQCEQRLNEQHLSDPFMGQIAVQASQVVSPGLVPTGSPLNHKDIYRQSMQQNFFLSCGYSPAILQTISQETQGDDPRDISKQLTTLRKIEELLKQVKSELAAKKMKRSSLISTNSVLDDLAYRTDALAYYLGDEKVLSKKRKKATSSKAAAPSSVRKCNSCGTTATGQWRSLKDATTKQKIGDLCNACGIRNSRAARAKKKAE